MIQDFIDNVSDKVIDYLRENKTQDMQEVKHIISLHFSDGLDNMLHGEDEKIVAKMEELTKEMTAIYTSSKRNAQINAELMKLSQQRKNIRKKAAEIKDASQFVRLIRFLRNNHSNILDAFYENEPKQKPFKKFNLN